MGAHGRGGGGALDGCMCIEGIGWVHMGGGIGWVHVH